MERTRKNKPDTTKKTTVKTANILNNEIPLIEDIEYKEEVVEEKKEETILTSVIEVRPKLQYKLVSGTLRIMGRVLKKNDVFDAYPEQIPAAFKKYIVCISDKEVQVKATPAEHEKYISKEDVLYEIRPSLSKDWYNVVNKITGKPLNEKTLRLADAEKLAKAVNI